MSETKHVVDGQYQPLSQKDLPTEPGIYWASCRFEGYYDSLLVIEGERPWLKYWTKGLPIDNRDKKLYEYRGTSAIFAVGPKFIPPSLGDNQL